MAGFWRRPVGDRARGGIFHLRVDERLVHGQVVVGWGVPLEINCLILANDALAGKAADRELYLQIIPEEMGGLVLTVNQAVAAMPEIRKRGARCLVVVQAVDDALKWVEGGMAPDLLILGGVHQKSDRRRILDYVALSPLEIEKLKKIARRQVKIVCQDVWNGVAVDFDEALRRAGIHP
jgi:PTS system mannose-specific IIB component/fructoselysine and glucoselysine-specific PTS system IIB component